MSANRNKPGYIRRKQEWLQLVDKWCLRHSITREQALSIMFEDSAYNPDGEEDLVTMRALYWNGADDFALDIANEAHEKKRGTDETQDA